MNTQHPSPHPWARRAVVAWIVVLSAFAALVCSTGCDSVTTVASATAFLGIAGVLGGWSWTQLVRVA